MHCDGATPCSRNGLPERLLGRVAPAFRRDANQVDGLHDCHGSPPCAERILRGRQGRDDVKVYGVNGNAQAIENIKNGHMTATAWEDSYTEGYQMVKLLKEIKAAGKEWKPRAAEVPAVLISQDNVAQFLKDHPDAAGK